MVVAEKVPGDYDVDAGSLTAVMAERGFSQRQLDDLISWVESATNAPVSVSAQLQHVHERIRDTLFIRLYAGSVERPASSNGVFPARDYFQSLGEMPLPVDHYSQWAVDGHYVARAISELPSNVCLCVE